MDCQWNDGCVSGLSLKNYLNTVSFIWPFLLSCVVWGLSFTVMIGEGVLTVAAIFAEEQNWMYNCPFCMIR